MLGSEGFKLDERRDYDYSRDLQLESVVEKLTNRTLSFEYLGALTRVSPPLRERESVWCRPHSGYRHAGPQVCFRCLSDFPYLGLSSRLTFSMVCLRHSVFLTDLCSVCKKVAFSHFGGRLFDSHRWSFCSYRVCGRCGANLCKQTQKAAAPAYQQLQLEIYRRLGHEHTYENAESVFFWQLIFFAVWLIERNLAGFKRAKIVVNTDRQSGTRFSTLKSEVRAQLLYVTLSFLLGQRGLRAPRFRYEPDWVPELKYLISQDSSTHDLNLEIWDTIGTNSASLFDLVEVFRKVHERTKIFPGSTEVSRENPWNDQQTP